MKTAVLWVVAAGTFTPGQYEVQGSFSFLGPGIRASGCKIRVNGNGTSLYEPRLG